MRYQFVTHSICFSFTRRNLEVASAQFRETRPDLDFIHRSPTILPIDSLDRLICENATRERQLSRRAKQKVRSINAV